MRVEEESLRNRSTIGVAAQPAEDAIVVAQLLRSPFGLIATVRAVGVDERRKGLGIGDDDRIASPGSPGRQEDKEQGGRAHVEPQSRMGRWSDYRTVPA